MIESVYRELMIQSSRTKYIDTGITKNITEALRLYLQDVDPDEQVPLFITTPELHQVREILIHSRPQCDECDGELHLQIGAKDRDGKTWPTAWMCKTCGIEYYSDKTAAEWLEELRIEARKQNIPEADKPHGPAMPAMRKVPEI